MNDKSEIRKIALASARAFRSQDCLLINSTPETVIDKHSKVLYGRVLDRRPFVRFLIYRDKQTIQFQRPPRTCPEADLKYPPQHASEWLSRCYRSCFVNNVMSKPRSGVRLYRLLQFYVHGTCLSSGLSPSVLSMGYCYECAVADHSLCFPSPQYQSPGERAQLWYMVYPYFGCTALDKRICICRCHLKRSKGRRCAYVARADGYGPHS